MPEHFFLRPGNRGGLPNVIRCTNDESAISFVGFGDAKRNLVGNQGDRLRDVIAGPASATVMSDFGAEVFKDRTPRWRRSVAPLSASAASQVGAELRLVLTGRNKKSVALDLGSPDGYEASSGS